MVDELVLLPCPLCNDLYHEQIDLDKHVANDHEPLATRSLPFNKEDVNFEIENIEYCDLEEWFRLHPLPIIKETPKKAAIGKKHALKIYDQYCSTASHSRLKNS